jgi:PAS domain-containing protein
MDAGLTLGAIFVIAGLLFGLLAWAFLRLVPRLSASRESEVTEAARLPGASEDGVVVIHPGGRVGYVNARARDWFGLPADAPADLDELMRRVRPSDDFLISAPLRDTGTQRQRPSRWGFLPMVPGSHPQMLLRCELGAARTRRWQHAGRIFHSRYSR